MSLAPQELENTASKYASEAIKFDSQGARGMAITHYQQPCPPLTPAVWPMPPITPWRSIGLEHLPACRVRIALA